MSDFLATMAVSSRLRADAAEGRSGATGLESRVSSARPVVPLSLSSQGFDLIAEPKLASPAEGRLAGDGDDVAEVLGLAAELAASGAAALSILTEPDRFGGSIEHLELVSTAVDLPVLRKDFLVDPVQVLEARAAGASGVLLIARLTEAAVLTEMVDLALDLGMFALVEVFEEADLEAAAVVYDRDVLVGVNARDLATLDVEPSRHRQLAPLLPAARPWVAESGMLTSEDSARVANLGYRLALVGTSLVKSPDPGSLARRMLESGRRAATVREAL